MSRASSTDLLSMLSTLDQRALQFRDYTKRSALTATGLLMVAAATFVIIFPTDLPGLLFGGVDIPDVLIEGKDAPFKSAIEMSRGGGGLSAVISEASHAAIVTLAPFTMTTGIMFIFAGLYQLFNEFSANATRGTEVNVVIPVAMLTAGVAMGALSGWAHDKSDATAPLATIERLQSAVNERSTHAVLMSLRAASADQTDAGQYLLAQVASQEKLDTGEWPEGIEAAALKTSFDTTSFTPAGKGLYTIEMATAGEANSGQAQAHARSLKRVESVGATIIAITGVLTLLNMLGSALFGSIWISIARRVARIRSKFMDGVSQVGK